MRKELMCELEQCRAKKFEEVLEMNRKLEVLEHPLLKLEERKLLNLAVRQHQQQIEYYVKKIDEIEQALSSTGKLGKYIGKKMVRGLINKYKEG